MVLADLGSKITSALKKLSKASRIDEAAIDDTLKEICNALLRNDVNVRIVKDLRDNVKKMAIDSMQTVGSNRVRFIERGVYKELVRMVTSSSAAYRPKKMRPNVFMFVGLQGSGKTTSIAKFANYWHRKGWKTAMVCCDTFRAGAFDQLKQNAIKLHIPFYGDLAEADPVRIAESGVKSFTEKGYEIILVDTSGRHRQEDALFEEMEQVREAINPNEVIFVVDSTIGQAVSEQAEAFKKSVAVGSVIITKLDGNAKGGGAISACAATNAPITFIGTGEHFDNFQRFDADSFIGELLGKGNMRALIERLNDNLDPEKQKEMSLRIAKGQYTLRDLRDQLTNIMQAGSISSMIGMMPAGVGQMLQGQSTEQVNKGFRQIVCLMDSMTNDELDGVFHSRAPLDPKTRGKITFIYEKTMSESRMQRIAKGAGVNIEVAYQLVRMHQQFGKMFKMGAQVQGVAGSGPSRASIAKLQQQFKGNRKAMMQAQMKNMLGADVIANLGGVDKVMEMVAATQGDGMNPEMAQQMTAMGGMPSAGIPSRGRGRR